MGETCAHKRTPEPFALSVWIGRNDVNLPHGGVVRSLWVRFGPTKSVDAAVGRLVQQESVW